MINEVALSLWKNEPTLPSLRRCSMAVRSSGTESPGRFKVWQAFGLDAFSIVIIHYLIGNLGQNAFRQCRGRGLRQRQNRYERTYIKSHTRAWVDDTGKVSLPFLPVCKRQETDRRKHSRTELKIKVSRWNVRIGRSTSHLQSCAIFMNCVILQKLTWGSTFPNSDFLDCEEKPNKASARFCCMGRFVPNIYETWK